MPNLPRRLQADKTAASEKKSERILIVFNFAFMIAYEG
jgi:hypothetical protein